MKSHLFVVVILELSVLARIKNNTVECCNMYAACCAVDRRCIISLGLLENKHLRTFRGWHHYPLAYRSVGYSESKYYHLRILAIAKCAQSILLAFDND